MRYPSVRSNTAHSMRLVELAPPTAQIGMISVTLNEAGGNETTLLLAHRSNGGIYVDLQELPIKIDDLAFTTQELFQSHQPFKSRFHRKLWLTTPYKGGPPEIPVGVLTEGVSSFGSMQIDRQEVRLPMQ